MRTGLVCGLVLVSFFVGAPSFAEDFFSIDQANDVSPRQNYNISSLSPTQSFTTLLGRINRIDVYISDAGSDSGPGANFIARVRGLSMTNPSRLADYDSEVTNVADNSSGYVRFKFSEEIPLWVGRTTFEIIQLSTGTGTRNYMWATGSGDTYDRGSPTAGTLDPRGDFLFRVGLEQENRMDLTATLSGSVQRQSNGGSVFSDSPFVYKRDFDTTRGIVEYDLGELVARNDLVVTSAEVSGEIAVNNFFDNGNSRDIDVGTYSGDLELLASDFDTNVDLLGTVFDASTTRPYRFDTTDNLNNILQSGGNSLGVAFDARNLQAPNVVIRPVLTVTVASASEPVLLGDINLDEVINFLDITPFIGLLSATGFQDEADCNQDGSLDFLDINPFIQILAVQ